MTKTKTKTIQHKLDFSADDPEAMKKLVVTVTDLLADISRDLGIEHAFLLIVNETESGFTHLMTNVEQARVREFADVMTRHVTGPATDPKPTIIVPPGTRLN